MVSLVKLLISYSSKYDKQFEYYFDLKTFVNRENSDLQNQF